MWPSAMCSALATVCARGEHFEPFVTSLQKLDEQEKKMANDPQVASQVFGLKHFLEDFTLIADKQIK